jgi:signal transduction histidine kinase
LDVFPDLVIRRLDRYFRQVLEGQSFLLSQRLHKYLLLLPPSVNDAGQAQMQQTVRIVPQLEDGAVRGVLCLIEDVSERVASEEGLQQRAAALAEANRHKDDFLAMLAHELRNPLGPTRNAVQVLQLISSPDPEAQKAKDIIARQVTHMSRLIDDLLDVSRLGLGKVLLRTELLDLVRLVRQSAEDYRSTLEASGIDLSVELPNETLHVMGDATRLAQMVGNLLHNAQKFTDVGGRVSLRVAGSGRNALITVQDTGIGMQPDIIARVFDTFSQADRSLARSRGGLGLGLALVKGLAELHGGSVLATSAGPGLGSTFVIELPLHPDTVDKPPVAEAVEQKGQPFRILVIEDNRDAAESTRMLLTLIGHEVKIAHTGESGIRLAHDFLPQVILCDIGLPGGLSGYDVARRLRQEPGLSGTYLIALTGYGRDEDQQQTQAAGFDVHFTKPVDFVILQRTLNSLPRRG